MSGALVLPMPLPHICIRCGYTGFSVCLMHGGAGDFYVCRDCYIGRPREQRAMARWAHGLVARGPLWN